MTKTASLLQTAPETLLALRAALLTRPDLDTVYALRDAGYAGGEALYQAFDAYVREKDLIGSQDLAIEHFFHRAGEFLTTGGWGKTTFSVQDDAFCTIEIDGCWEGTGAHQPDPRGCHLTVGLLGAFLGKYAEYPVAVLETEGPESGSHVAKFIAGNTEMVADFYARNS